MNISGATQVPILNDAFTLLFSSIFSGFPLCKCLFVSVCTLFGMNLNLFVMLYDFVQSMVLRSTQEKDGIRYDSDFARIEQLIKGNTFTRYFFRYIGALP